MLVQEKYVGMCPGALGSRCDDQRDRMSSGYARNEASYGLDSRKMASKGKGICASVRAIGLHDFHSNLNVFHISKAIHLNRFTMYDSLAKHSTRFFKYI